MKVKEILNASSLKEFRTYGSYFELKNSFEKEIDNKLGINSWITLFSKIQRLKISVTSNRESLRYALQKKYFKESKKEISEILGTKIKARSWSKSKNKVESIITLFSSTTFNPHSHYKKTKLKKFKDSSKLEGIDIDIEITNKNTSLESVIAKCKR